MHADSPFIPLQQASTTIAAIVDQSKDKLLQCNDASAGSHHAGINTAFAKLPTTFYDDAINTQLKPVLEGFPSLEFAYFLEVAFRQHFLAVQNQLVARSLDLKVHLFQTLDLLLRCQELGLCEDGVPLALMEEVLDLQAIDNCESIYEYLELRKERLTVGMEPNRGKGLTLLRLCNELLKRLSRAKNTVFCGRILVFLAGAFPPSEQSGVNKRGEYNTENVTVVESEEISVVPESSESAMEVDDGKCIYGDWSDHKRQPTVSGTTAPSHADWEFYRQFWGLQECFSNPAVLANSREKQAALRKGMEDALARFSEVNDERRRLAAKGETTTAAGSAAAAISSDSKDDSKEDAQDAVVPKAKRRHATAFGSRAAAEATSSTYFPKFLTSPALLKLEISDPYFRRHILLQFLIMIDFLLDHAEDPQKDWSTTPNKAMIPSWTVDSAMATWAADFRRRIGRELAVTSMSASGSGRGFTLTVKNTLIHEKSWTQWKADNCKPFEKVRMDVSSVRARTTARDRLKQRIEPVEFRRSMGCASLTELWESSVESDFWDEVMMTNGQTPKDVVGDYLNGIDRINKMMPIQRKNMGMPPMTPEESQERDKSQLYKALRLGSEFSLHLYNQVVNAPNGVFTIKDFLAALKKDEDLEKEIAANGGKLPPRQPPQQQQQQHQQQQQQQEQPKLEQPQQDPEQSQPQQDAQQQPSMPESDSAPNTATADSSSDTAMSASNKMESQPEAVKASDHAGEELPKEAQTSDSQTIVVLDDDEAEAESSSPQQESSAMEVDKDPTGLGIVIVEDDTKEMGDQADDQK
ncbi:hypothetical protein BGZ73_006853 [Actinomortierella ambigua]|nr:hypothetical protein BGZ73_006853 [Actinomortierella ambigua]